MSGAIYLSDLNREQRQAVEHGVGVDNNQTSLLVIAGAGSGKTKTLAHRVAHLIINGSDPRRILLLTFSRRAATELARRVQRISAEVLGTSSKPILDALTWAGTFHGIGRACCVSLPIVLASLRRSQSTIARIQRIS